MCMENWKISLHSGLELMATRMIDEGLTNWTTAEADFRGTIIRRQKSGWKIGDDLVGGEKQGLFCFSSAIVCAPGPFN